MKSEYMTFVEELRKSLLRTLDMEEEKIFFKKRAEGISSQGDRLFIECAFTRETKEICGIYTDELYTRYKQGISMEKIAEEVIQELDKAKKGGFFEKTRNLLSYEKAKEDLFIRLINRDRNKEELKTAVYHTLGDIALVLYMKLGEIDNCTTSMKVQREQVERWGVDSERVFKEALENTFRISPPRIYNWEKLVFDRDYQGEDFMDTADFVIKKGCIGNCLSTARRTNGAVAVFLPGVARRLAQLMGQDFYLVFTSIHEVMIHNASMVYPEDLQEILKDTVNSATPESDYLTSRIYRYCRVTGGFICV